MTKGYWCDACCSPVRAGDVIPDLGAEGDGHRVVEETESEGGYGADDPHSVLWDDYLDPEVEEAGVCYGPVRRIG